MTTTILHLSDTHNRHRELKTLPDADILIHSGDFTLAGTEQEVFDFLEWFQALPHRHKIFIAGNHDDCLFGANIEGLAENCHYLCNAALTIEGIRFYGLPIFMEGAYETEIRKIPPEVDILISHQPPYGILDLAQDIHYGSRSLGERVNLIQPKYHLFGHIHDAYGTQRLDETVFVNSSVVNENYELVNKPKKFIINNPLIK